MMNPYGIPMICMTLYQICHSRDLYGLLFKAAAPAAGHTASPVEILVMSDQHVWETWTYVFTLHDTVYPTVASATAYTVRSI